MTKRTVNKRELDLIFHSHSHNSHRLVFRKFWRGSAVATTTTRILDLVMVGIYTWLCFGFSSLFMVWILCLVHYPWREIHYLGWILVLRFSSRIILSIKVKGAQGKLCTYGWVTILLYFLWKNENISFIITQELDNMMVYVE
jgi:hypothetical protein